MNADQLADHIQDETTYRPTGVCFYDGIAEVWLPDHANVIAAARVAVKALHIVPSAVTHTAGPHNSVVRFPAEYLER